MERKIGEVFDFEGKKLKAIETHTGTCYGCFFKKNCVRSKVIPVAGQCYCNERTDKKQVIFVEAEQPIDEEPRKQEELNLCEKLKYCPEGTTFWSPLLGDVKFWGVSESLVTVEDKAENSWDINSDSTLTIGGVGGVTSVEPMLFPSREQRDWSKVHFETPVEKLPKSWAEFCNTHEVQKGEVYIKEISTIYEAEKSGDTRDTYTDMNILPSREAAEAHLALMQLHQLRDAWREGWVPDWNDGDQDKYVIAPNEGEFMIYKYHIISRFLAFQDKKRADKFRNCFIDLIRKAGDLI